jgi:hypothetical protein
MMMIMAMSPQGTYEDLIGTLTRSPLIARAPAVTVAVAVAVAVEVAVAIAVAVAVSNNSSSSSSCGQLLLYMYMYMQTFLHTYSFVETIARMFVDCHAIATAMIVVQY